MGGEEAPDDYPPRQPLAQRAIEAHASEAPAAQLEADEHRCGHDDSEGMHREGPEVKRGLLEVRNHAGLQEILVNGEEDFSVQRNDRAVLATGRLLRRLLGALDRDVVQPVLSE